MDPDEFLAALLIHEVTHICLLCMGLLAGRPIENEYFTEGTPDYFYGELAAAKADQCARDCSQLKPVHGPLGRTTCSCNTNYGEAIDIYLRRT